MRTLDRAFPTGSAEHGKLETIGLFTRRSPAWENIEQFNALTEQHYGTVYAVAMARLGQHEAAEDVAQETFLRAFLQYDITRGTAALGPWLIHVARNLAVDLQRRGKDAALPGRTVSATGLAEVLSMEDQRPNQQETLAAQEERTSLERALEALPVEEREVLLLHYMEGMTKREIAARLGLHPSSVGRQMDRSLALMRDFMEGQLARQLAERQSVRRASQKRAIAHISAVAALGSAARAEILAQLGLQQSGWVVSAAKLTVSSASLPSLPASIAASGVTAMAYLKATAIVGAVVLVGIFAYGPIASALKSPPVPQAVSAAAVTAPVAPVPIAAPSEAAATSQEPPPEESPTAAESDPPAAEAAAAVAVLKGSSISGTVTFLGSGLPAPGATVMLRPAVYLGNEKDTMTVNADEEGNYRIQAIPAGSYIVTASREMMRSVYDKEDGAVSVDGVQEIEGQELKLFSGFTVTGKVHLHESSEPVEGVRIFIAHDDERAGNAEALSDSEGNFRLDGLFCPATHLKALKQGYRSVTGLTAVSAGLYTEGLWYRIPSGAFETTLEITMRKAATVSGRVVDHRGQPVPTATVQLFDQENSWNYTFLPPVPVAPDGTFTLEVARQGSCYIIAAVPDLYEATTKAIPVADEDIDGVEIVIHPPASLAGIVVGPDGQPFAGAQLRVGGSTPTIGGRSRTRIYSEQVSGEDGRFHFTKVPPAAVTLVATATGYADSERLSFTLEPSQIRDDLRLQVHASLSIKGHVVDQDGKGVEGAHVNVLRAADNRHAGHIRSGPVDGAFEIENLPEGEYRLKVSKLHSEPVIMEDVAAGGEEVRVVLHRRKTHQLAGYVIDRNTRKPIATGEVVREHKSGEPVEIKNGRFVLDDFVPDSYNFTVSAQGYLPRTVREYNPGLELDVLERTYELSRGGSITGIVLDRTTRKGIENVRVGLINTETPPSKTDAEGRFLMEEAPAGHGLLEFTPPAPYTSRRLYFTVQDDDQSDVGEVVLGSGGTINVSVIQMPEEVPSVDVDIVLKGVGASTFSKAARTDAEGRTIFSNIPAGAYEISCGVVTVSVAGFRDDEERDVNVRIGTQALKGRIFQGTREIPGNIELTTLYNGTSLSRTTFSDGKSGGVLTGLFPGSWNVVLTPRPHGGPAPGTKFLNYEIKMELGTEEEWVFQYPSGEITLLITDEEGVPVAGAEVAVQRSGSRGNFGGGRETTDAEGLFRIYGMKEGSYDILARKEGKLSESFSFHHPSEDTQLGLFVKLLSVETGTLESIALRLTEGEPIPEAWCRVYTGEGINIVPSTRRDSHGRVQFTLPVGTYRTNVSHWGHSESERMIEITAGKTTTIEDVLYEAGGFRWVLHDQDGAPLVGAHCTVTPRDPSSIERVRTGMTDHRGYFNQRGLQPGEYIARATLADGRAVEQPFDILAHEHTERTTSTGISE